MNIAVQGLCPMGCGRTLFLADGGHVTCSWHECPRPSAADELLHLDDRHVVTVDDVGFTVEHPTRERVEGSMHNCAVFQGLRALDGAPVKPGRYRVEGSKPPYRFEVIP